MKNIVILDGKTLGCLKFDRLNEFGNITYYDTTSNDEVVERIKDAHIILTNKVVLNKDNLVYAKNLELICETATGFNNIDIEYAKDNNIAVTNVAGYSTNTVAQHTFACLLNLYDKISYYDKFVKNGDYTRSGLFTNLDRPFNDLEGKTYGIIGLGAIGRKVATIAEAFGMNVIYYSTSGKNNNSDYKRVEFDDLLKLSDVISIHAPLTDATKGLIDYENMKKMKKSAVLINMGRGPIVKEDDLARAIDDELILGAALDVFEVEPIRESNPLLNVKNKERLLMTPHIAWSSVEARERLFQGVIDNIKAFYNGENLNRLDI